MMLMPYLIGIVLSLGVAVLAKGVGFDRDRAFYPAVLIVVASYSVLFAVIGGSPGVLVKELLIMAGFTVVAVAGFKSSLWLVAIGLFGHGVFDAVHGEMFANPGMPAWWPPFCMAYDVGAAVLMAVFVNLRTPARTRA